MIAISAGHHIDARGAAFEGFSEYPETEKWALFIWKAICEKHSPELVVLVPVGTLPYKVRYINSAVDQIQLQLAVEVHFNSSFSGNQRGSETLYCPESEKGKLVAGIVQDGLAAVFPPSRGIKEGWYKMGRPGVVDYGGDVDGDEKPDYFLRATHCPAIIIEPEFIQNSTGIIARREYACGLIADKLVQAREALL